jgi:hypothetical protein
MHRRRILKTRFFHRWALRADLTDTALRELAHDLLALNERQIDAQAKSGAFEEIIG